jgi:hypothetical protein
MGITPSRGFWMLVGYSDDWNFIWRGIALAPVRQEIAPEETMQ